MLEGSERMSDGRGDVVEVEDESVVDQEASRARREAAAAR